MVRVFGLVRTALAEHGTVWLNIGDSYSSGGMSNPSANSTLQGGKDLGAADYQIARKAPGIPPGNLCLIPQRLALALQADGWLVRSVVVWHKPAPMPASVAGWAWRRCRVKVGNIPHNSKKGAFGNGTADRPVSLDNHKNAVWEDCPGCPKCLPNGGLVLRKGSWRCTSSWEPILMLAKNDRYFCDGEAVKTPAAAATVSRDQYTRILDDHDEQFAVQHDHETICDGANLRDVWKIAAEPLHSVKVDGKKIDHYASFPSELVHRCLKAATSAKGYCPSCGMPWCRVIEQGDLVKTGSSGNTHPSIGGKHDGVAESNGKWNATHTSGMSYENKTIGWRPSCTCPEQPPRPALVLDPFSGSGRTGIECKRLGLDYVGIELNPDYVDMSRRLLAEQMPLFG